MLTELLDKNKNIIINTDIDGFLSGIILQKYCGANIVGFSNSKKEIWISPEVESIYDPIYIDLYVADPNVTCVEQHVVAFDDNHLRKIQSYGTKLNPNLERGCTFKGDGDRTYYRKYPFGTVHYILYLLGKDGVHVQLPSLSKISDREISYVRTTLGHILLRADDALYSTLGPYADNAGEWWKYLHATCKNSGGDTCALEDIIKYISSLRGGDPKVYKEHIGTFFKSLGCDGLDGAFDNILNPDGTLQRRVQDFYTCIKSIMECDELPSLPEKLQLHAGAFKKAHVNGMTDMSILDDEKLFSYAFTFGQKSKYPNFSYTLDMV